MHAARRAEMTDIEIAESGRSDPHVNDDCAVQGVLFFCIMWHKVPIGHCIHNSCSRFVGARVEEEMNNTSQLDFGRPTCSWPR